MTNKYCLYFLKCDFAVFVAILVAELNLIHFIVVVEREVNICADRAIQLNAGKYGNIK